jgi:uncharacterized protein involved in response to NO
MKRITRNDNQGFSIFESAFRPFFILAGISSLFYMIIWTAYYSFKLNLSFQSISPTMWHAHEMLFGYTAAVIAGFLLTVEKYWLGVVINKKFLLISLLTLWVLARVLISAPLISGISYLFGAIIDCLFLIVLTIRVLYPIISTKAWGKIGLAAHLAILAACNIICYLGLFGIVPNGQRLGVYSALYIVISFIILMGRRMIPIFVRNALMEYKFEPKNHRVIDILSMLFIILFFILELFFNSGKIVLIIAGMLAVLYSVRLYGWYSNKIWDKPLLWVMFAAYSWIVVGFALIFLSQYFDIPYFLSIHSFTYGAIGIMTIGFMSRVILGHTGRNVFDPPNIVFWIFTLLLSGAVLRVFFPLIDISNYRIWIGASQLLWILSFLIFAVVFFPMLLRPAIEKKS